MDHRAGPRLLVTGTLGLAVVLSGCSGSTAPARTSAAPASAGVPSSAAPSTATSSTAASVTTPVRSGSPSTAPTHRTPVHSPSPSAHRTTTRTSTAPVAPPPAAGAPVIVVDPGHSRTITATDPKTGLTVSDYENEPEMDDVFAVARLVRTKLEAAGYRVVLTKTSVGQRRSLLQRAQIADDAHAALALSIHDQAGSSGGIGFRAGNNIVYYQSVGDYRSTDSGHKVYFTDAAVAARSKRYGRIFATQRGRVQGTGITVQGDTGYDLGSRGLAGGNIWLVQLLSHVPWIYNEAGGNSAGRTGLSGADEQTYADALVAGVEHCIPPPR